jgi:hypothetical protein
MDTDPKEPMQQSNVYMGNYRLLFNKAHEARMKQAYVITDLDRINILESGKKNAPTRHAEKKQYLTTLFEARDEILRIAETLDATFVINLRNHLDDLLPKTISGCKKDNATCSRMLVSLFDPLAIFKMKLQEQHELEKQASRTTRGKSASRQPLYLETIDKLLSIKQKVDKIAAEENIGDLFSRFKPVTLTPTQQSYRFCQARHDILSPLNRQCPYCLHFSVNSLPENDSATMENERELNELNAATKVWNDYKKRVKAAEGKNQPPPPLPLHPISNTVMKQPPKKKQLRIIIEKCMCSNSGCISKNDVGSSCFIKCINEDTGARYEYDSIEGCTCVVCKCQCPGAWDVEDRAKIALGISQVIQSEALSNPDSDAPEGGVKRFLQQSVRAGTLAANAVSMNIPPNVRQSDKEEIIGAAAMEATASAMARTAGSLPLNARLALQANFGQSTVVTLPDGSRLDTTMLGGGRSNLHTNNNRLSANITTHGQYLRGMKDHQHPSFQSVTNEFRDAAQGPTASESILGPIFNEVIGYGGGENDAASLPAPAVRGTVTSTRQMTSDESYARRLQLQEQESYNAGQSTRSSSNAPIILDDERKMPAKDHSVVVNLMYDDSADLYNKSTPPSRRSMRKEVIELDSSAPSSLTSDEARTTVPKKLSAAEKTAIRNNNARESLDALRKHNNKMRHNNKSKSELTQEQKNQRKEAKKRKILLEQYDEMTDKELSNLFSECVYTGDKTLSAGPLSTTPNTTLIRLERAQADSSDSDEEKSRKGDD